MTRAHSRARSKPVRKRTNNPDALRAGVLDVAADLFQEHGYNGTTIHDIVDAAGVTSGGLHHHFPTKKDIGLAVLRERVGPAVSDTWIAPLTKARSTLDGVKAVFGDIADDLEEAGAVRGCPLNNLTLELSFVDREFRAEAQTIFTRWRTGVAEKIRSDQGTGKFKGVDANAAAAFVVAAYSGAIAMAKAEQRPDVLRTCGRELVRQLKAMSS
jgi:AcrR family transcriptional regulator